MGNNTAVHVIILISEISIMLGNFEIVYFICGRPEDLSNIQVAIAIFVLAILIENLMMRHYLSGAVLVTTLTIMLAEYSSSSKVIPLDVVINSRFWDTLIGCIVGLLGMFVIHSKKLRPYFHRFDEYLRNKITTTQYQA